MVLDYGFEGDEDEGLQAIAFLGKNCLVGWRKYGVLGKYGLGNNRFC